MVRTLQCWARFWMIYHIPKVRVTCDTFRARKDGHVLHNPRHGEKTGNLWLPCIDLLTDLWHRVLWACCCLGTNFHQSHTCQTWTLRGWPLSQVTPTAPTLHPSGSTRCRVAVFDTWAPADPEQQILMFTWASRRPFDTSANSMLEPVWSSAALIAGEDSSANSQRTHVSFCRISNSSDWLIANLRCRRC